ncbi:MAG: hypothetical protein V1747_10950 [Candidatus Omnitrophota bacterium]
MLNWQVIFDKINKMSLTRFLAINLSIFLLLMVFVKYAPKSLKILLAIVTLFYMFPHKKKNRMKPFPENQSDAKKLDWFKKTQPWDEVDERIMNAVIKKYNGNPMIIVFVYTSMEQNLIPKYCKLNNSEYLDSPDVICSLIALMFYNVGSDFLKQLSVSSEPSSINLEKLKLHYSTVMNSLESCVILDENQFSAYLGLAIAKRMLNGFNESLIFAKKGMSIILKLKKDPICDEYMKKCDEYKKNTVGNTVGHLEEIEKTFAQLISELEMNIEDIPQK